MGRWKQTDQSRSRASESWCGLRDSDVAPAGGQRHKQGVGVEAVLAADELGQGCGPSGEDNKELPRLGWAGLDWL
jgi:hypothetical protein